MKRTKRINSNIQSINNNTISVKINYNGSRNSNKDDLILENSNEKEFNLREIIYDNIKKWYNGYKI